MKLRARQPLPGGLYHRGMSKTRTLLLQQALRTTGYVPRNVCVLCVYVCARMFRMHSVVYLLCVVMSRELCTRVCVVGGTLCFNATLRALSLTVLSFTATIATGMLPCGRVR